MQKYWVTVDDVGNIAWYKDAKMIITHRVGGPAIEYASGTKAWFLDGQRLTEQEHAHRVNPAQEMTVAEIEKALGKRIKIIK